MVQMTPSKDFHHVMWADLHGNGVGVEIAVVKKDKVGNLYFINLTALDAVDKNRMFKMLTNRNAANHPLWDMMSQTTLGNGQNALHYFHQLVRILTLSGEIILPNAGTVGMMMPNGLEQVSVKESLAESVETPTELTPAEKAAATRAKNKAIKEAEETK